MKPKVPLKAQPKSIRQPRERVMKKQSPLREYLLNEPVLVGFFLLLTLISYWPVFHADFIPTWDDKAYVIDNMMIRSLSFDSIRQMFSSQVGGTYVPLPLLSYAIEYKIWGLNPLPFHITNLVLHLICTYLVFKVLCSLKIGKVYAAAATLIYGIHPMGVESVAWVTERKDLLYSVFYFGALLLYIYYVQATTLRKLFFALSLGVFILALFSKIQAVSLPLVLLLVDYYFRRTGWVKLVIEKLPFFILSIVFGVAGIFVLRSVGALKINDLYTLQERIFFGIYTFDAYFLKFFVPATMSSVYPYPVTTGNALPALYYLSPLLVIILGIGLYRTAGKTRAVVFGGLFFLFSVFFMLQIFGAGAGFLADRYVKVPYLGLVFIAGWGLENIPGRFKKFRPYVWAVFLGFCSILMASTYQRCNIWKNGETLWSDVIQKYPGKDSRPYACRGLYYRAENENDKALADFNTSLTLSGSDDEIMLMRGNIFFDKGKDDSAYMDYIRVIRMKMDNALALGNLGAIYVRRNQPDSAVFYLNKSIQLDSANAVTYANRAVAYGGLGNTEQSILDFKHYLSLKPNDERVFMSVALAYQKLGRFQESIGWFDKAINLKPNFGNFYFFRSQSYKYMGNRARALADGIKARDLGANVPPEYIQSLQ